jgi:hypothetical protein
MTEAERILAGIQGGPELLEWFGGRLNFGDAEVVELQLVRHLPCMLVIDVPQLAGEERKYARVTFHLENVADIRLKGWSQQNVIDGLDIRKAPEIKWDQSLIGTGISEPDHMIEIAPLAGAFGKIVATISRVEFKSIPSWYGPDLTV